MRTMIIGIGHGVPDRTVWWKVDLGRVYNIYSIIIMFKNYDNNGVYFCMLFINVKSKGFDSKRKFKKKMFIIFYSYYQKGKLIIKKKYYRKSKFMKSYVFFFFKFIKVSRKEDKHD